MIIMTDPMNADLLQPIHSSPPSDEDNPSTPEPRVYGSKKRPTNGPSARSVANLTPEQLAKKRANDREVQRSIRKRTKERIESLESQVRDLSSQQPYQELQSALRERDTVLAENQEIRRRLEYIISMLQPMTSPTLLRKYFGLQEPIGPSNVDIDPPSPPCSAKFPPTINHDSSAPAEAGAVPAFDLHKRSNNNTSMAHGTDLFAVYPPWPEAAGWASGNPFDFRKRSLSQSLDFSGTGERLGLNLLLDSSHQQHPPPLLHTFQEKMPDPASAIQDFDPNGVTPETLATRPLYTIPIRYGEATCAVDDIFLTFLRNRQREVAEGANTRQAVGPPYPSISSLLNPTKQSKSHPISQTLIEVLSTLPVSSLPDRVALFYIVFLLVRWQIFPTEENYNRIPEWYRPIPRQLLTPHPIWMDYIINPSLRDILIAEQERFSFETWFMPYYSSLSLAWGYEPTDTLLATGDSDELMINPVFERHLSVLSNWSLGPMFASSFPDLAKFVRIRKEDNFGNETSAMAHA